ncbi:MAG TPA: PilZ domain-containing protein [Sphingomicrobium sp.]|jgi:hypothetical protein|nr:PilZ domain-containing protein [Sphingomicrobium sp.]
MGAEPNPAAMKLEVKPVERRERRPVSLRALVIRQDGSTAEIHLLDLSYEGCGIETPVELAAGEAIKLSVLCRGAIDAHVRWCKDGRAGLVFAPEKTKEKKHWPRQSERTALSADVSLRRLGQNNYSVRVNDLSPDGCKVELVERPRVGEHLLIKFDGLEVLEGEVCWIDGYVAGLRFEKAIHPAVFDLLVQRIS